MRTLVTGANGYLGAHICETLIKNNFKVTALCRTQKESTPLWGKKLNDIVFGDITKDDILNNICKMEFDNIIHLVSLNHTESETTYLELNKVNILPLWKLLETFTNKSLKKFIYFSTQQVYGNLPPKIIDENHVTAPVNKYGLTHLLCENIVDYYNKKTDTRCINLRLSNGYGEPIFLNTNCWSLVINNLVLSAFKDKKIKISSDGRPQRDFIHTSVIVEAVSNLLKNNDDEIKYSVINLSSGNTYTILEIAKIVKTVYFEKFNLKIPIYLNNEIYNENENNLERLEKYQISNDRLRKLGIKPEYDIKMGISNIFNFLINTYQNPQQNKF